MMSATSNTSSDYYFRFETAILDFGDDVITGDSFGPLYTNATEMTILGSWLHHDRWSDHIPNIPLGLPAPWMIFRKQT